MPDNQNPYIPIPENGPSHVTFVSEESFEEHKKNVRRDFDFQNVILIGIVVVFFVAFLTFVFDAWKFHSETNTEYSKTIEELRKENYEIKLQNLSTKIDQMQDKLNQKVETSPKSR